MRHFSSPRVKDLEFTMYDDGSGGAEYKGKKVGSVDLQTKEIRLEGDTWTPYPYESRILEMFIEQAERYAIKNYNAEKHFAADIDNIYIPPRAEGLEPEVRIYLKDIREDDVFEYIERSDLLSQTSFSNIYELMYSTQNFNSGLGAEAPTLSVSISVNINDDPKMEIVFEDGEGYPYAEVSLTEKEKAEINSFIEKELGCKGSEYAECLDEKKFENLLRDVPYDETTAFWREIGKLDEYDDKAAADKRYADLLLNLVKSAKLNRAAAAELLLTADMITISELSPYFKEDKKASLLLNETTAEFLINKSPELKQVFEDKGYDNWRAFFENNRGQAYIEANDVSDIGITVVINDDKEYPIPLSSADQAILREKFDEEVRRRNKEDLEDKDGDHIPDRIDSTFSPEGYRTQTNYDYNENRDNEYRTALVTSDEYEQLQEKGFKCQKAKVVAEDGRIPIRYKAAEKENFEKIIHSLGGKHGGIHI